MGKCHRAVLLSIRPFTFMRIFLVEIGIHISLNFHINEVNLSSSESLADLTMSLSTHVHHASYPYYDPPLTDEQQDQIDDLLAPFIPNTTKEHPSLSALPLPASQI